MVYNPPKVTTTLAIYLTQWLKVASGDRVTLSGGMNFGANYTNTGYFIFKCGQCKDNWHVGHENFPNDTTVPAVLKNWVIKHRHICDKFYNPPATSTGTCQKCHWPYTAHDESWLVQHPVSGGQSAYFDANGNPLIHGVSVEPKTYASELAKNWLKGPESKIDTSMMLKQFKGRKFRDAEPEDLCESQDTNDQKI